jgi:PAS domain S-box-containing protein
MPFPGKGAVLIELSGRIAFASTYFCDLVGIEHDKIAGMSFFAFVYPEDMEKARKMFEPTKIPSAEPSSLRLRRIDGGLVSVEIHGAPMEDASSCWRRIHNTDFFTSADDYGPTFRNPVR